jgi:hypothetical protein
MSQNQERQRNRSKEPGPPGGGSGSKTNIGRSGQKKVWGDASPGPEDSGARGSTKQREAERRGQEAPGGGKRKTE